MTMTGDRQNSNSGLLPDISRALSSNSSSSSSYSRTNSSLSGTTSSSVPTTPSLASPSTNVDDLSSILPPGRAPSIVHLISHTGNEYSRYNRTPTDEAQEDMLQSWFEKELDQSEQYRVDGPRRWVDWYSSGDWDPASTPDVPVGLRDLVGEVESSDSEATATAAASSSRSSSPSPDADSPDPSSVAPRPSSRTDSTVSCGANNILEFYRANHYLPGPKTEKEEERLRLLKKYDLDSPTRRAAIDRICRLGKAYFKTPTVLITLVMDDKVVSAADAGFDPQRDLNPQSHMEPLEWPREATLCGHNITRTKEREDLFIVPDLKRDWRFKHNPSAEQGLRFYAAATIRLPMPEDEVRRKPMDGGSNTIPVGSFCLLSDKPRSLDEFPEADRQMLRDLSALVSEQFNLGFERLRKERELAQTAWLGSFLQQCLVYPLDCMSNSPYSATSPIAPTTTASQAQLMDTQHTLLSSSFQEATRQLLPLTGAQSAAILDLRTFRFPRVQQMLGLPILEEAGDEYGASSLGKIFLLGSEGNIDWEELIAETHDRTLARAIIQSIARWQQTQQQAYIDREPTPFTPLFPEHVSATTIVPIAEVDGVISLMLVLTSSTDHFVFEPADQKFASNVGSVLASALLRERAQRADNAKLAFVSQVSHELRTPIFAVASQLELLREFSTPTELQKIRPMLDVADVCLDSLRDVLDDTLDVAKFSNSNAEMTAHQKSALARTDLSKLAAEVAQACFIRKRRSDLVTTDESEMSATAADSSGRPSLAETAVDLILEVEDRPDGWTAWVDVGGLKRVLLNLLGNSLKFTERGHVKMTLRDVSSPTSGQQIVTIEVEDTGCGMSEEFLRSGSVFTPFMQENPFITGAGLGLSICQTIAKRMNGTIDVVATGIGRGTTFRITLPLEFSATPPDTPISPRSKASRSSLNRSSPAISTSVFSAVPRTRASSSQGASSSIPSSSTIEDALNSSEQRQRSMKRRVISDELLALFSSGTKLASVSTPFHEKPERDFSAAVDAAQSALGPPALKRVPSSRTKASQRPALVSNDSATTINLVDEVAKLSMAGAPNRNEIPSSPPKRQRSELSLVNTSMSGPSNGPSNAKSSKPQAVEPKELRVLFADDNAIARNILAKLLSGKGVSYVSAVDGDDAVRKFEGEGPFHLLLLDVQMPNKDGIEAAFDVRRVERERNLPPARIVALSGLSNEADMSKAGVLNVDGPVDHWIVKGNKSLRQIMTEVMLRKEWVENGSEGVSPTSDQI